MDDRARAAVAGHEGDEATARALLGSADGAVRATALAALERMECLDEAALGAGLRDGDAGVRRRAVGLAVSHPAVPLVPLLDDPDPSVAEQAAWACGERQPTEDGAVA